LSQNARVKLLVKNAKFIKDSRLFISLAAVGMSMSSLKMLGLQFEWRIVLVVFASTHFAYILPLLLKVNSSTWWWKMAFMGRGVTATICIYLLSFSQNSNTYFLFAILCFCTLFYYLPLGLSFCPTYSGFSRTKMGKEVGWKGKGFSKSFYSFMFYLV